MNYIQQTRQNIFILELFILLTYLILILLEIKTFIIWEQITYYLTEDIYSNNDVLLSLYKDSHPHLLRILLIYIIYQISIYFSLDVNMIYNIILVFLLFFTYILIKKIINDFFIARNTYKILVVLLFLFTLSNFMNGRIVFAIFGNTLLLYALYFKNYSIKKQIKNFRFILLVFFSIIFTSVSSGTFMVCLTTIFLFYFLTFISKLPYIEKKYFLTIFFINILIILFIPLIIKFINKNLEFYNGSIIEMLDHGFGKYIDIYIYPFLIILIILPFIMIVVYNYILSNYKIILPLSMILSSFLIGLFGYSSFVSGISGFILFFFMIYKR